MKRGMGGVMQESNKELKQVAALTEDEVVDIIKKGEFLEKSDAYLAKLIDRIKQLYEKKDLDKPIKIAFAELDKTPKAQRFCDVVYKEVAPRLQQKLEFAVCLNQSPDVLGGLMDEIPKKDFYPKMIELLTMALTNKKQTKTAAVPRFLLAKIKQTFKTESPDDREIEASRVIAHEIKGLPEDIQREIKQKYDLFRKNFPENKTLTPEVITQHITAVKDVLGSRKPFQDYLQDLFKSEAGLQVFNLATLHTIEADRTKEAKPQEKKSTATKRRFGLSKRIDKKEEQSPGASFNSNNPPDGRKGFFRKLGGK